MIICLYGHTGAGKSTLARMMRERLSEIGCQSVVLKLADPLYRLQSVFYSTAGCSIARDGQDQELLEDIARHLRRLSATSLVDDFRDRLADCGAQIVINDDLRDVDVDYPFLRSLGARFVHVKATHAVRSSRLAARQDVSTVHDSKTTSRLAEIVADLEIDNSGSDLRALREAAVPLIVELIHLGEGEQFTH